MVLRVALEMGHRELAVLEAGHSPHPHLIPL